ncbi:MAG: geranylgeranyl reductase family protein [Acidimicrobiia bacterium]
MTGKVDILVVGAGPAGAAAALTARARGLDVLVVDKASFPRDKTCGDGLTASALRRLEELGVDAPALPGYESVRETVLVSPSGRHVHLPLPGVGDHSAVVPRAELDAALVQRVRACGVEVRESSALTAMQDHDDAMRAELGDGTTVDASFVIAADGHWSAVRRLRDARPHNDFGTWHAVRQYFRGVDDRKQWVLFERDLLPGYAWVFPLANGRANVGFGVLRDEGRSGKELAALWRDVIERPAVREVIGPTAEAEGRYRAWPIPTSYAPSRLTDGRVLYAGDAASVVDPMTGEGIAQALETGMLAIEALLYHREPGAVAARYQRAVDRSIGRDLRFSNALQRVLRSPFGARAAIRAAGLTPWTRRNFARWMFEDYPRAVVLTPDRWHPGMFTTPGAYRAA